MFIVPFVPSIAYLESSPSTVAGISRAGVEKSISTITSFFTEAMKASDARESSFFFATRASTTSCEYGATSCVL